MASTFVSRRRRDEAIEEDAPDADRSVVGLDADCHHGDGWIVDWFEVVARELTDPCCTDRSAFVLGDHTEVTVAPQANQNRRFLGSRIETSKAGHVLPGRVFTAS